MPINPDTQPTNEPHTHTPHTTHTSSPETTTDVNTPRISQDPPSKYQQEFREFHLHNQHDDTNPVTTFLIEAPITATLLILIAFWVVAKSVLGSSGQRAWDQKNSSDKDALAKAREIQQQRLLRTNSLLEKKLKCTSNEMHVHNANDATIKPKDPADASAATASVLMKKTTLGAASKSISTSDDAAQPGKLKPTDPKSYTARLQRLERGKGSSSNPLKGYGGSGSSNMFCSRTSRGG